MEKKRIWHLFLLSFIIPIIGGLIVYLMKKVLLLALVAVVLVSGCIQECPEELKNNINATKEGLIGISTSEPYYEEIKSNISLAISYLDEAENLHSKGNCIGAIEKFGIASRIAFDIYNYTATYLREMAIRALGTKFVIEVAHNTTLNNINVGIRNIGTTNINMSTIEAYVNDVLAEDNAAGTLTHGGVGSFVVTVSAVPCDGVLKLREATGYKAYVTIKC